MAQDESVRVWIVSVESESADHSEPHYFYRLGAGNHDLVRELQTASFQLAPDRTLDDDGLVRVGLLSISRRRSGDYWSVGSAPHHYYLQGADRQATVDALLGVELQHSTRITYAVERMLGERWDLRLP